MCVGGASAAVHRGRVAAPRAPAGTGPQQASAPGGHLPVDLQCYHVAHLHLRDAESRGQPGE